MRGFNKMLKVAEGVDDEIALLQRNLKFVYFFILEFFLFFSIF
ncbi:Uncharacterised protein [Mycobacterium tuberculosis]|nr:Uncharacterised protein [Mycobacterium tuberculosis]